MPEIAAQESLSKPADLQSWFAVAPACSIGESAAGKGYAVGRLGIRDFEPRTGGHFRGRREA
jgi:hypothetical protein